MLTHSKGVPDALEGTNTSDNGNLALELARAWSRFKVRFDPGEAHRGVPVMLLWRHGLLKFWLLCWCHARLCCPGHMICHLVSAQNILFKRGVSRWPHWYCTEGGKDKESVSCDDR